MQRYRISQKLKQALRIDRAFRFVWQAAPGWTIAEAALVVVQGAIPLLTLYLIKLIVDAVTFSLGAPDRIAAFRHVILLIGFAAAAALLNALFQQISGFVKEAQTLKVTDHMYDILHAKSIEADLDYYENSHYLDTLHRAQQEGPYRPTHMINGIVRLGQSGISLLAMVGLLFSFHWMMAVILLAAAAPGILVRLRYSDKLFHWQRGRTQIERKAAYFNWMLTGDAHAKEIRLFNLGNLFRHRFSNLRNELRRERLEISKKRSFADLAAQCFATFAVFGSFGFIALRTVQGIITLGDMVMYFQAFQKGLDYLRGMLGGLADLYENSLFLSNFYEFLDLEPKIKSPLNPVPVPRPIKTGIIFNNVSFRYPSGNREVLKDISLSIAPGEVVALVGGNGSGKTSFVKLLCRLYDPCEGTITVDGIDLRHFETMDFRRQTSVIFQDYAKYHLSVLENIWFGDIFLPLDYQSIKKAAIHAGVDGLITKLPKGYDTILGKWFGDGEELSVGQWQKMALARAFLRDSQIIVLDEPTSALDAKSEYDVFQNLRYFLNGRSAVIISHRFSTVKMADRIYVFDKGKIIENGTHEQLIRFAGTYADFFEKQTQHYTTKIERFKLYQNSII